MKFPRVRRELELHQENPTCVKVVKENLSKDFNKLIRRVDASVLASMAVYKSVALNLHFVSR